MFLLFVNRLFMFHNVQGFPQYAIINANIEKEMECKNMWTVDFHRIHQLMKMSPPAMSALRFRRCWRSRNFVVSEVFIYVVVHVYRRRSCCAELVPVAVLGYVVVMDVRVVISWCLLVIISFIVKFLSSSSPPPL